MRRLALCCCAVLLASCSKSKEQPAEDAMADAGAAAPAAAPIALSDVAGKWNVRLMAETGDSTLRTYQMVATADTMGWEIHFPDRPPVPVRVLAVNGDSIVTEAGPFESVVRKGIQVTSRSVNRLQDGKLVSVITAHYQAKGPDSVSTFRSEATRAE